MGEPGRHIGSFHDSVSLGYVREARLRSQQSPGFIELASSGRDRQAKHSRESPGSRDGGQGAGPVATGEVACELIPERQEGMSHMRP